MQALYIEVHFMYSHTDELIHGTSSVLDRRQELAYEELQQRQQRHNKLSSMAADMCVQKQLMVRSAPKSSWPLSIKLCQSWGVAPYMPLQYFRSQCISSGLWTRLSQAHHQRR